MIYALLVLLINSLEYVVHGLGGVHARRVLLSPPQAQVQTELKGVVVVGVEDEGVDLGDLHDLAVGAAVGAGLEDLALGSPMGVEAQLRQDEAAARVILYLCIFVSCIFVSIFPSGTRPSRPSDRWP